MGNLFAALMYFAGINGLVMFLHAKSVILNPKKRVDNISVNHLLTKLSKPWLVPLPNDYEKYQVH